MTDYNEDYESNEEDIEGSDSSRSLLLKYAKEKNIAEYLDADELQRIGFKVISGYQDDTTSHKRWLDVVEEAQKLSKLEYEPKNTPLPQSANIKFPLITDACYQYAARTYPIIVDGGKAVQYEIFGPDPDGSLQAQAQRLENHMNYTLLGPDNSWEVSLDKLLVMYPNTGFCLKKTYWDPTKKKIESVLCGYKDVVLRNEDDIHELADLRRITHVLYYHTNDLVENSRYGIFLEETVEKILARYAYNNTDTPCVLYEQHRFLDLDHDGYEEPYIVTVDQATGAVLRIVARYTKDDIVFDGNKVKCITPIQYFTDFHFLPSSDGRFMSVGYGTLMLHLNATVNTILNQLIDAGTLANMQGGIIDSRLKINGNIGMEPGQWNKVKGVAGSVIKDGIFPIVYKEPSTVLYQLLGTLIQASKDLTASTDALQGSMGGTNVPATTMLALIEQGLKKFSSIQKRLYRSLKSEYEKIARLNRLYMNPQEYMSIAGGTNIIFQSDYETKNINLVPIADPNISSDTQRMAQAQILGSLTGKGLNDNEIYSRILGAAKIKNIESIVPPPNTPKQPDPKILQIQTHAQTKAAEIGIKARAQSLKEQDAIVKHAKAQAEITQMQANAVRLVSEAGKNQKDAEHQNHTLALSAIKTKLDATAKAHQQGINADLANRQLNLEAQDQAHGHSMDLANRQQEQSDNAQETPSDSMDQSSSDGNPDSDSPAA